MQDRSAMQLRVVIGMPDDDRRAAIRSCLAGSDIDVVGEQLQTSRS